MFKSRTKTIHRERILRAAIWLRDGGRDRATDHEVHKNHFDWHRRGEVCHIKSKGSYPELKYEESNCILLSAYHHYQSDFRGGHRLKILGDDANGPITFVMTDKHGAVLWERTSSPPHLAVEKSSD